MAYEESGRPFVCFRASREGLVYLRGRIDEALEKGKASIGSDADFGFREIVVQDIHPDLTLKPRSFLQKSMGWFFLLAILAVIGLAIYGGRALYADWRHILK